MKVLVAYFSRHGHTKKVGKKIAKILKAEEEEIIDLKDRSKIINWFYSAFDEELKTPTKIQKLQYNPSDFDLVVIGTPIWDGIPPAVKEYLRNKFKKVAFFITFGASAGDAPSDMARLSKKPVAVLELQDRNLDDKKIRSFCKELSS